MSFKAVRSPYAVQPTRIRYFAGIGGPDDIALHGSDERGNDLTDSLHNQIINLDCQENGTLKLRHGKAKRSVSGIREDVDSIIQIHLWTVKTFPPNYLAELEETPVNVAELRAWPNTFVMPAAGGSVDVDGVASTVTYVNTWEGHVLTTDKGLTSQLAKTLYWLQDNLATWATIVGAGGARIVATDALTGTFTLSCTANTANDGRYVWVDVYIPPEAFINDPSLIVFGNPIPVLFSQLGALTYPAAPPWPDDPPTPPSAGLCGIRVYSFKIVNGDRSAIETNWRLTGMGFDRLEIGQLSALYNNMTPGSYVISEVPPKPSYSGPVITPQSFTVNAGEGQMVEIEYEMTSVPEPEPETSNPWVGVSHSPTSLSFTVNHGETIDSSKTFTTSYTWGGWNVATVPGPSLRIRSYEGVQGDVFDGIHTLVATPTWTAELVTHAPDGSYQVTRTFTISAAGINGTIAPGVYQVFVLGYYQVEATINPSYMDISEGTSRSITGNVSVSSAWRAFTPNITVTITIVGAEWYVDGIDGNDGNTGLNWDNAFKTVTKAVSVAQNGNKIFIRNGPFSNEPATINITNAVEVYGIGGTQEVRAPFVVNNSAALLSKIAIKPSEGEQNSATAYLTNTLGTRNGQLGLDLLAGTVEYSEISYWGAVNATSPGGVRMTSGTLRDSTVEHNMPHGVAYGGGTLTNNTIRNNVAFVTSILYFQRGGGIQVTGGDTSLITGNNINHNYAWTSVAALYGAADPRRSIMNNNRGGIDGTVLGANTVQDNFSYAGVYDQNKTYPVYPSIIPDTAPVFDQPSSPGWETGQTTGGEVQSNGGY